MTQIRGFPDHCVPQNFFRQAYFKAIFFDQNPDCNAQRGSVAPHNLSAGAQLALNHGSIWDEDIWLAAKLTIRSNPDAW
jgi:hypothetical protein